MRCSAFLLLLVGVAVFAGVNTCRVERLQLLLLLLSTLSDEAVCAIL